jgi:hypothetical protein
MKKRKKFFVILVIVVLALVASYVVGYWISSSSKPFKISQKFIYESAIVKNRIGQITNLRQTFFGYSINYIGPRGWAEFEITVSGDKGRGIVFISLEKKTGEWAVLSARLRLENGLYVDIK